MKNVLFAMLFISTGLVYSQLGYMVSEIKENNKESYDWQEKEMPTLYTLSYWTDKNTKQTGVFSSYTVLLFQNGKDKPCTYVNISEPISEMNSWVNYFQNKGYVKVGELKWKDYELGIIYQLSKLWTSGRYRVSIKMKYY